MSVLPDLARYDRVAFDTETTGLGYNDRPVGLSLAMPDGTAVYARWGHERGGNNCSLMDVRAWALLELCRRTQVKIGFNAPFDMRMLAYAGIPLAGPVEDASTACVLLNERERWYGLDAMMRKYTGEEKADEELMGYLADQFGGKPARQGPNIWRAPGDLVEPYALQDARGTLHLYDAVRPLIAKEGLEAIYALETALLPLLVRMHLVGVRVDLPYAERLKAALDQAKELAVAGWEQAAPGLPLYGPRVAEHFAGLGVPLPRTAPTSRHDEGQPSLTKDILESLADTHPVAAQLLVARMLTHYSGTFLDSYVLANADPAGVVHGEFHPLPVEYEPGKRYGAVSGRFSSGGALNLQNLPGDRFPWAGLLLRRVFVPYLPGQTWWKVDYSQIEYRFLAHYAGGIIADAYKRPAEPGVCRACGSDHSVTGMDFHCMLTLLINRLDICPRRRTKNVNFAYVYGAGVKKAAATAGVDVATMKEILQLYDEKTEGVIKQLAQRASRRAADRGFITTWGGRKQRFMSAEEARRLGWHLRPGERFVETHKALNRLLQGSAADLIKMAMVRVAEVVDWETSHLHLTVHDELALSGPPRESAAGQAFERRLREAMEDFPLTSGVPIKAAVSVADSWGTTKVPTVPKEAAGAEAVLVDIARQLGLTT